MSRAAALLAAVLLWAVPASAQTPQTPAPSVHAGTKLSFAPTIGSAKFESSSHFGPILGLRGPGDTYTYSVGKMQLTVDVFDTGRRVGTGGTNPTVANQFDSEANATEHQIRTAGYTRFERPTVPSTCTYGAIAFRCIVFSAQAGANRMYSKMLLTGYNGSFVKIAIVWSITDRNTQRDADQALNEFIPALMR